MAKITFRLCIAVSFGGLLMYRQWLVPAVGCHDSIFCLNGSGRVRERVGPLVTAWDSASKRVDSRAKLLGR